MTVRVSLPAKLGQRDVMINSSTTFAPGHGVLLRRCGDQGCDPFSVPPASCVTLSYQQAMLSTGPPMHAVYQVLGRDGRWLVLDVAWPGGPAGMRCPVQAAPGGHLLVFPGRAAWLGDDHHRVDGRMRAGIQG